MNVPSGRVYGKLDLKIIRRMAKYGFIRWQEKPFRLHSGIESHVYVSGREDLTDHPDLVGLIGKKIALTVKANSLPKDKQPCLIGIPTAGTTLAQAASTASSHGRILVNGQVICFRTMREVLKGHGAHSDVWVNGEADLSRHTYWTIDNVITSGESLFDAETKFLSDGYPNKGPLLILADRGQGGIERLKQYKFQRIVTVYRLIDLVRVFGELNFWPEKIVKSCEEELSQSGI